MRRFDANLLSEKYCIDSIFHSSVFADCISETHRAQYETDYGNEPSSVNIAKSSFRPDSLAGFYLIGGSQILRNTLAGFQKG